MCFGVKSGKMNYMTPPTIMNYPSGVSIHVNTVCPTSIQDFISVIWQNAIVTCTCKWMMGRTESVLW